MNHSLSVFLINKHARAIMVRYEPERGPEKDMLFKSLDPDLKVDDLVIIPTDTRYKFTVAKIVAADVDVDYDSPTKADWIVSRVDTDEHKQILADEAKAVTRLRAIEIQQRRDKMLAGLMATDQDGIKSLELYSNGANNLSATGHGQNEDKTAADVAAASHT